MNASHFGMTRATCVCCSITSLTSTAQGSRVCRHGRSRSRGIPQCSTAPVCVKTPDESALVTARQPLRKSGSIPGGGGVVRAGAARRELALPHHHTAAEVADLFAILIEALALHQHDAAIGLALRLGHLEHPGLGVDGVAVERREL